MPQNLRRIEDRKVSFAEYLNTPQKSPFIKYSFGIRKNLPTLKRKNFCVMSVFYFFIKMEQDIRYCPKRFLSQCLCVRKKISFSLPIRALFHSQTLNLIMQIAFSQFSQYYVFYFINMRLE